MDKGRKLQAKPDARGEPVSQNEQLSGRLKSQFAPAYLTLTSIIQGVALATLASRVEDNYLKFSVADWLLAVATFIAYLTVWHEYLMQALAFIWVPTLLDSAVPFAFLACELFLAHFIFQGLRTWLLVFALTFIVGIVARGVTVSQSVKLVEENREVTRATAYHGRIRIILSSGIIILTLAGWAFYNALHLWQMQTAVALVALVMIVGYLGSSVPYWNKAIRSTRAAHQPRR